MGAANQTPAANYRWSDTFWVDVYNKAASNLTTVINDKKNKSSKKNKVVVSDSDSDSSSDDNSDFDGELVI